MKTTKPTQKKKRRAKKTDWKGLRAIFTGFLLMGASILLIIQNARLSQSQALTNLYQQQVTMALTLYDDAKMTSNSIYLGDDVNCAQQLMSSEMIQIKIIK